MPDKVALITGVTGQDGAYLARLLLGKGYIVHGIKRRSSSFNTERVDELYLDPHEHETRFIMHYGDLTDATNVIRLVQEHQPDEIYNLAAQSHVQVSFETPEYTANADALGTLRLLEAIRILKLTDKVRFYKASTSELYGKVREVPSARRRRSIPARPTPPPSSTPIGSRSTTARPMESTPPTGSSSTTKPAARRNVRHAQDHTRRRRHRRGLQQHLYLGNLDAKRDWGHARDYVEGMWLILQQPTPDDYVLATGSMHSVREFVELAFRGVGRMIEWRGTGVEEVGLDRKTGKILVRIDPPLFPADRVDELCGDPSKARERLGWSHKTSFKGSSPKWSQAILRASPTRAGAGPGRRNRGETQAPVPMAPSHLGTPYALAGKRVWVAGHNGMVGSALVRRLAAENCEILTVERSAVDLTRQERRRAVGQAGAAAGALHGRGQGGRHCGQRRYRRTSSMRTR